MATLVQTTRPPGLVVPKVSSPGTTAPAQPADLSLTAARSTDWIKLIGIYSALAALIWIVFGQTIAHPFVNYDDPQYVYENPRIAAGLTTAGIKAAFTQFHARNWHPLTTISHMLDCQLFGLNPAGHHLVNVLLHTAAALLLLSVLRAMTGALWRSAFVAALFAIHPLRAESVAWIAERKDVLSGVCLMLTLGAYLRYVRAKSAGRYLIVLMFFLLGLMTKPTLVTAPVLLLLLDYWPLGRVQLQRSQDTNIPGTLIRSLRSPLLVEKIPFFIASIGVSMATLVAQRTTVAYSDSMSFASRLANAVVTCAGYIGQMVWPAKLTVFYPVTVTGLTSITVVCCAAILIWMTAFAISRQEKYPSVIVGWSWYLVSLLPMIGLVKAGLQGQADRYTYIPQIGLAIAVTWFAAQVNVFQTTFGRRSLGVLAVAAVGLLAWRAADQTTYWKSSDSLWSHALAVTPGNAVAHYNLAAIRLSQNRLDDAIDHYEAALRSAPVYEDHTRFSRSILENALGNAVAHKGDLSAAVTHYREAVRLQPDFADARSNLSSMLLRTGDVNEAISEYEKVVALPPEDAVSHKRLGDMLMRAGRIDEAMGQYGRALVLARDNPELVGQVEAKLHSYRAPQAPPAQASLSR